jgi:hypothetical protein
MAMGVGSEVPEAAIGRHQPDMILHLLGLGQAI